MQSKALPTPSIFSCQHIRSQAFIATNTNINAHDIIDLRHAIGENRDLVAVARCRIPPKKKQYGQAWPPILKACGMNHLSCNSKYCNGYAHLKCRSGLVVTFSYDHDNFFSRSNSHKILDRVNQDILQVARSSRLALVYRDVPNIVDEDFSWVMQALVTEPPAAELDRVYKMPADMIRVLSKRTSTETCPLFHCWKRLAAECIVQLHECCGRRPQSHQN
jgi:hypothetical protein